MLKKQKVAIRQELVMTKNEILQLAKNYMNNRNVDIVLPGEIGEKNGDRIEVVFLVPDALDPNVAIICPQDNRVWVNVKTKEVTWIEQM